MRPAAEKLTAGSPVGVGFKDLCKLGLKDASVQQPPFPCNDPLLFVIRSASLLMTSIELRVEDRGIPHLAKNERDAPNFLHAALDKTACAPLF